MTVHTLGLTPALDVVYTVRDVTVGRIHRPSAVVRSAGGKSLNVARALARLGVPTRAIVPLGGGLGDLVAGLLDGSGVQLDRIDSNVETRMCVTVCDVTSRTSTEFYEPVTATDVTAEIVASRTSTIVAGEWLTVSGAFPSGDDAAAMAEVLREDRKRGVRLAIDIHGPSLRTFIDIAEPDLVKINRSEAAEVTGSSEPCDAARWLADHGAASVVITDGEAGSIAIDRDGGQFVLPAITDPGLFPVGSGDCFLAGLTASSSRNVPFSEALDFASRVAAANAERPGAAVFDPPQS